jgi:purine-nucleoside/S-methyl-5'-thioadenosine phosphorylase / adenosine deaminase
MTAQPAAMLLQAPGLAELPWLVHGFSTRQGGVSRLSPSGPQHDLNLGKVSWDAPRNVAENRRRLLSALRPAGMTAPMTLIVQQQIHSDLIRVIDAGTSGSWASSDSSQPLTGDGLITSRPARLLAILAADCLPILLVDVKQRVVAALHCGWRGTLCRIAAKGVGRMSMLFGSRPQDLRAAIGPGIRACCYKVGPEVEEAFSGQFPYWGEVVLSRTEPRSPLEKKYPRIFLPRPTTLERMESTVLHLDLVTANLHQLREAGIAERHIWSGAPCTSCNPQLFFSHRRDAGRTGRMMGVIGIRNL